MWTSIPNHDDFDTPRATRSVPARPLDAPASLGVADLTGRYSVAATTVRSWLRSGDLKGRRIGRDWRISWKGVFAFEGGDPPGRSPRLLALARAPLMTPDQVAATFGCTTDTILRWRREGRLSGIVLVGRVIRFRRDLLEKTFGPSLSLPLLPDTSKAAENSSKTTVHYMRKTTSR